MGPSEDASSHARNFTPRLRAVNSRLRRRRTGWRVPTGLAIVALCVILSLPGSVASSTTLPRLASTATPIDNATGGNTTPQGEPAATPNGTQATWNATSLPPMPSAPSGIGGNGTPGSAPASFPSFPAVSTATVPAAPASPTSSSNFGQTYVWYPLGGYMLATGDSYTMSNVEGSYIVPTIASCPGSPHVTYAEFGVGLGGLGGTDSASYMVQLECTGGKGYYRAAYDINGNWAYAGPSIHPGDDVVVDAQYFPESGCNNCEWAWIFDINDYWANPKAPKTDYEYATYDYAQFDNYRNSAEWFVSAAFTYSSAGGGVGPCFPAEDNPIDCSADSSAGDAWATGEYWLTPFTTPTVTPSYAAISGCYYTNMCSGDWGTDMVNIYGTSQFIGPAHMHNQDSTQLYGLDMVNIFSPAGCFPEDSCRQTEQISWLAGGLGSSFTMYWQRLG
jgi:hypothetical protein